jgi:two-component system, OmpR family, sensor histidine kinase KdpD
MPAATTQRASPDAILAIAKKGGRGRLKVFLGAAPGVGKTFAMLSGAHVAKAEGRDVAVGLVETHGRRETEALLAGLELIPRKPVIYVNKILSEFDIDKALARKPGLLLLDELAHTNIPGSRHPKRWQDVEELLAAGVDVWTTLNVQHLEGLNDILQRITGVRVRETVPDHVFEDADEIVLVDLSTDELLKRLAEGKVYVPDMADRARKRFFKPENLTALRELALRRAAERIDADLIDHMRAQAIDGPWPAGERILACVGPDSDANSIVRAAKRLADVMDAPWIAVTVEGPSEQLSLADRRYVDAAMTLARSLGAETATLAASDIAAELLRFSKFENVTQIVLGRSRGGFITELLRRSLPHELLRRADGVAVHVITGSKREARRPPGAALPASANLALAPLVWSTVAVAGAVAVGQVLTRLTTFPNISMIFLMAVVFSAVTFGIWPAVYASVLSFLAYNLFFIEPLYTFTIARPHELLALFIFLAISVVTSTMAGRIREQAQLAVKRMRATRRLYEFSRRLSGVASYEDIPEAAVAEIHTSLGRPAVVLLSVDGELELRAAWPPEEALDTASMTAARWAIEHDEPAGADTATLPAVPWLFLPLKTVRAAFGVVGVGRNDEGATLDLEARTLLDTLAEQTGAALDRASLGREMVAARSAAETERVRNTLLASISHDFRTPLASILGSATSLIDYGDKLGTDDRNNLLADIRDEAQGLDEMVRNLLAMTRIDAGALEVRRDWVDLREVAQRAADATRRHGAKQKIAVRLPDDLPMVRADAKLVEQALANVVANAVAHTPAETHVVIDAEVTPASVTLRVTDDGGGIRPDLLPHVFEKFVHERDDAARAADGGESTGLGLAIAKGIMDAHGGVIDAASPIVGGRGTRVTLTFPREGASA